MHVVELIKTLRRHQDTVAGYALAATVLVLAIVIRQLVDPYIRIPYITLFPAMVICSLVGGRIAGILAAVVGGLIAWYFWLPPRFSLILEWPTGHLSVLLYVLTSTILLLLTRGLNETLKALEKERDLSAELFRELQHRTANNLQSVSALLRQNRKAIEDNPGKAIRIIDGAMNRFEIMSRINRRLYSPQMLDVAMAPYLEELCRDVLAALGSDQIVTIVRSNSIVLNRERAMLVSLLLAELLMNASKHAFPPGAPGSVTIALNHEGSNYQVKFTDDGRGLPDDFDPSANAGLGMRIVQGLVGQLNGSLHTGSGPSGTTIEIRFPATD
jgi:two-component sensor histidine kinase